MGFLQLFRLNNNTSHIQDLKAIIIEYKIIIEDLRKENEYLKEKLFNIDNSNIKSFKTPNTLKLSKKETQIYNLYKNNNYDNIEEFAEKLKLKVEHLRVYKHKIIKKGYDFNL